MLISNRNQLVHMYFKDYTAFFFKEVDLLAMKKPSDYAKWSHCFMKVFLNVCDPVDRFQFIIIIGERAKRARHSQVCSIENRDIYTRIMVTIKKRAGVIPYSFSSSIALLSSLLSCSFYLLDLRTISSVDILEMT